MSSGPPRILERIVAPLLPPACREEVLGDLREKYKGIRQYIGLVISVIPLIFWSRLRRTADARRLFLEALLVYASYLSAAWYLDRPLLASREELSLLAAPAALFVVFVATEDVWARIAQKSSMRLVGEAAMGSIFAFLLMARILPETVNLLGACAGLLLASSARLLFRSGVHLTSGTAPSLLLQNDQPSRLPVNTREVVVIVITVILTDLFLNAAGVKGAAGAVVVALVLFLVLLIGFRRGKSGKE